MQAPSEKAGGHSPLPSSCTLLHVALHKEAGSCLFPLENLQESSISLAQLSQGFEALSDQVVAENMGPGARLPGSKSQLYHCLTLGKELNRSE